MAANFKETELTHKIQKEGLQASCRMRLKVMDSSYPIHFWSFVCTHVLCTGFIDMIHCFG